MIEFNFLDDPIDLARLMDGFRRVIEIVSSEELRAISTAVFPVQYSDRLRLLNQYSTANALKATAVAQLVDHAPWLGRQIFDRLASTRVDLAALLADEAALSEHVRRNIGGTFHLAGTCRMGPDDDRDAVVDTNGGVRGIAGLSVIDASIMPTIPRGNTFLPTVMLAEKLADAFLKTESRT